MLHVASCRQDVGHGRSVLALIIHDQHAHSFLIHLLHRVGCLWPFHFVSGRNIGLLLINPGKKLPYILKQEIGLLERGEVPAPWHFSLLYYVVGVSNPAKRRDGNLPGKIRVRDGSLQTRRWPRIFSREPMLAIDSHGGAHRVCDPVESDIGQKRVAIHSRQKIAVVVRKQLKFAYHPGQPPNRRVSQGISKSLRFTSLKEKKAALFPVEV